MIQRRHVVGHGQTALTRELFDDNDFDQAFTDSIPLKRWDEAADIASLAVFLAGCRNRFMQLKKRSCASVRPRAPAADGWFPGEPRLLPAPAPRADWRQAEGVPTEEPLRNGDVSEQNPGG
jgi:hypothetical protein